MHVLAGQPPTAPVSAQQDLVDAAETIAETQGGCGHPLNSLALIRLYNHVEGSRFQEVDPVLTANPISPPTGQVRAARFAASLERPRHTTGQACPLASLQ
jgi:hypothetical protein